MKLLLYILHETITEGKPGIFKKNKERKERKRNLWNLWANLEAKTLCFLISLSGNMLEKKPMLRSDCIPRSPNSHFNPSETPPAPLFSRVPTFEEAFTSNWPLAL